MVTVPHIIVGLERMLDHRGVGLARFHCIGLHMSNMKGVSDLSDDLHCHMQYYLFEVSD